jgi:hypothetical protein
LTFFSSKIVSLVEFGPASRLEQTIEKELRNRNSSQKLQVLDIGSGGAKYWIPILQRFGPQLELHLLDPVRPKILDEISELATTKHIVGFAPEDLSTLKSDGFSVVAAFDLIEHMTKADGYRLLYEIDRICLGASVVFTPNDHVWQTPSQNNPFNAHISGWKPREFRRMGWNQQRGHTGIRSLFGPYGVPKVANQTLRRLIALTAILVRRNPAMAFAFSAIKNHGMHIEDRHDGVELAK